MGAMSDPFACPDPLAERRYAYARAAAAEGDWPAAAEVLEQALERAPAWAPALFALAEARAKLGDHKSAALAYLATLAADPEDHHGAAAKLALLEGRATEALPAAYIARVFDDYAPRFDEHLTGALGYRGPELITQALDYVAPGRCFARALDLGCGSGLAGAALRARVGELVGVDLSPQMVARARAGGAFDRLVVADLVGFLGLEREGAVDLAFAADALVYIGDLTLAFAAVAAALSPDGLFVFTVEAKAGDGYELGPGLRFRHSVSYLLASAAAASSRLLLILSASTRKEAANDVPGFLLVLQRNLLPAVGTIVPITPCDLATAALV